MKLSWWILAGVPLLWGCGGSKTDAKTAEDARQRRDTEIVLEKCDVTSDSAEKIDANGDGKPEMFLLSEGGKEICRSADLNFDGRPDRVTFFDDAGKIRRIESDFDRDGVVDEIARYEAGILTEKHRATTLDGKLDTWDFFSKGKIARTERDENGDGVIDQWWEYPKRGCPLIHVDADGDGRPDPGASIDYCKETGYTPPPVTEEEAPKGADFGSADQRVEETSNEKTGEEPEAVTEEPDSSDDSGPAKKSDTPDDAEATEKKDSSDE